MAINTVNIRPTPGKTEINRKGGGSVSVATGILGAIAGLFNPAVGSAVAGAGQLAATAIGPDEQRFKPANRPIQTGPTPRAADPLAARDRQPHQVQVNPLEFKPEQRDTNRTLETIGQGISTLATIKNALPDDLIKTQNPTERFAQDFPKFEELDKKALMGLPREKLLMSSRDFLKRTLPKMGRQQIKTVLPALLEGHYKIASGEIA